MGCTPESKFSGKVTKKLDTLIKQGHPLYYFVAMAGSIRGIPDIVGCYNGRFFAWELKPSLYEAEKTSGRIVLQRYTLGRIRQAQGQALIVHPDNFELSLHHLLHSPDLPPVPELLFSSSL